MGDFQHTSFSDAEKLARLRLIRSEGIGPISFNKLISLHETAVEAVWHLQNGQSLSKNVVLASIEGVAREMDGNEELGIILLYCGEANYPQALAAIADPPPVLSVLGDARILQKQGVGVVGARNASASGIKLTRIICKALAENGIVVTSGLARGIDAAAHHASVTHATIACLAGGVDVIYPRDNTDLYNEIAENGVLISEMALGTKPQARHFPRRNRIISGLSEGLLVIEAAKKSGSLISARFAADQGREVFAVPGSPLDPRAQGTNQLIKDGATLVQTAEDILNELSSMPLLRQIVVQHKPTNADRTAKQIVTSTPRPKIQHPTSDSQNDLLSFLSPEPIHIDEIVRLSGAPTEKVLSEFMTMELMGDVLRHSGNRFSRISTKN